MLLNIEQISQPYSGEYEEIIFDIESNWNSSDWSWIRFEEDTTIWCGEFRGKYIGATFSVPKGIIVVVTTDYIYVIDIVSKEMIDSERNLRILRVLLWVMFCYLAAMVWKYLRKEPFQVVKQSYCQ